MFIHIGNNVILESKDIIAIYNVDSIRKTKQYERLIQDLKEENQYYNENKIEEKSLIVTKEKGKCKGFVSNISSVTLAKRTQRNIKNRA